MDLNGWYYRYIKMIFGIVKSKTVCKALIKKRMMQWETVGRRGALLNGTSLILEELVQYCTSVIHV